MGINGLLPLLKSIQKPCNLQKFAGQTVGVDAYGWLHRGIVACSIELALGKPTRKYIDYAVHRVRMLIHFGVIPYIVFDGDYLPSKAKTEAERVKRREQSKQRGLELYRLNKPSQAHLEFQKAIDVTPEMARQFIDELKKINVTYVVAPYEADAQMVYLEKQGLIQGILSEDSDLLVFGAQRLLTKLDQFGDCVEINRADFTSCKEISLAGWTDADFRRMAILSGCDYLANINRMGLKTAYRLVRKHKTIERIIRTLQFDGQYHVPPGYLDAFHRADLTFLHQRVFCPVTQQIVMMTNPEQDLGSQDLSFIGDQVEKDIAIGVARGDLDPMTKAPIRVKNSQISTPPTTPWSKACRSVVGENLSSVKGNQSIESFFKSKRTPLAELNVNTFTPTPSQARILRQNEGAHWDAVSAMPNVSSLDTPITMPGGLPTPLSDRRSNLSAISTAKKRKMVNCNEIFQIQDEIHGTSSKFFTAATPENHGLKGRTKNRKKATDFTIWSDDSIEDTMIELASDRTASNQQVESTSETPLKAETTVQIPSEKDHCQGAQFSQDFQSTPDTKKTIQPETQTSKPPSTSMNLAQRFDRENIDNATLHLKEQSGQGQMSIEGVSRDPGNQTSKGEIGRTSLHDAPRAALSKSRSLTALQRLGLGALSRSKSYSTLSTVPLKRVDRFDTLLRSSSERKTDKTTPKTPPMPLAYTFGPDASVAKGSEDALIPNSESESSDVFSEVEEEPSKPTIDFGRFAFTG